MQNDYVSAVYNDTLARMRTEENGRCRRTIVKDAAQRLGVTEQTVYRNLKKRGWQSGRRMRKDQGGSTITREQLRQVALIISRGRNKRGRLNITVHEAYLIAVEAGILDRSITYSNLCRRLREEGYDRSRLCAQEPGIYRRSKHPNSVWFFDISVAIQWYFRDEAGKKLELYPDAGARFYEGKLENYKKLRKVIRRYLVTDHTSGAYFVRYYYGSGEKAQDVVDFLWHAMSESSLGRELSPFRGVPDRMVLDQGSANKSALVTNLLEHLGVEVEFHGVGNAKASGSVESRHNHWQQTFEGRLSHRPARDLVELNQWATEFAALACGSRIHSRHGKTPYQAWLTITPDQLTEAPDRHTFFQLAVSNLREGVLTNRLTLRADGRKWHVHGKNVYPGQRVKYRLAPFVDAGIRVWDAEERELTADELHFNEHGFPINGPVHEWGDDQAEGASHKTSAAHRVVQAVDNGDADDDRIASVFDTLASDARSRRYLSVDGQAWGPTTKAAQANTAEIRLSSTEAREQVARELGRPLGSDGAWWRARIGDGVTESELAALITEFTTTTTTPAADQGVG